MSHGNQAEADVVDRIDAMHAGDMQILWNASSGLAHDERWFSAVAGHRRPSTIAGISTRRSLDAVRSAISTTAQRLLWHATNPARSLEPLRMELASEVTHRAGHADPGEYPDDSGRTANGRCLIAGMPARLGLVSRNRFFCATGVSP